MEVFKVNLCTENGIDLISEEQLESLYQKIKDSEDIMIRWIDEDEDEQKSQILVTDSIMSRIKDGRFILTSSKSDDE